MNKKHDCNCGKPKCDGHCGISPAVLQINNPSECVFFRKVEVPEAMGTSVENPPKPGAYRNVLLCYKADGEAYLYSSDGIPTKITGTTSNYEILTNKPKINGVELSGDKSLADIGVTGAINTALEGYTPTSGFAEVAFSGDYEDLVNTPPKVVTHFYTLALDTYHVNDEVPIYNDEAMTDRTTYEQFVDAVVKGPVQFNQQYDLGAYNIREVYRITADIEYSIGFSVEDTPGGNMYTELLWDNGDSAPVIVAIGLDHIQINSDWNEDDSSSPAYIRNKPSIPPSPTVLDMTYNTAATTWSITDEGITLNITPDGTYPMITEEIQTFAVPSPVFTDSSTGNTLDAEGLYNLLETGADVVLNGVPIGVGLSVINSSSTFTVGSAVCDGVRLTKAGPLHVERTDPGTGDVVFSVDMTTYSATVSFNALNTTGTRLLPFAIRVYKRVTFNVDVDPDPQTEYAFEIQGTSYQHMDSPI